MKWILLFFLQIITRLTLLFFLVIAGFAILWRGRFKDCIATYDDLVDGIIIRGNRIFFWTPNLDLLKP